jgi:hypothetical protein
MDNMYDEVKGRLLESLDPTTKISLQMDGWKSPNNLSFQGIIGSYISRTWEKKEVLLGFEPMSGPHDGKYLAELLIRVLLDFGIEKQVFGLTTDNAGNNGTLANFLADSLQHRLNVSWLQDQNKLPCLAHVIQLVVNAIVETLDIESFNETAATSFSDNDIALLVPEQDISFKKTLQKVCIKRMKIFSNKIQ